MDLLDVKNNIDHSKSVLEMVSSKSVRSISRSQRRSTMQIMVSEVECQTLTIENIIEENNRYIQSTMISQEIQTSFEVPTNETSTQTNLNKRVDVGIETSTDLLIPILDTMNSSRQNSTSKCIDYNL